ncbi:MAG: Imm1 family immunity protein [Lachnospiraceae bacterium]
MWIDKYKAGKLLYVAKNDGDFVCQTEAELVAMIMSSLQNPYDDIWISGEACYPCLAILLNGNLSCVHYFLNDSGDMWQSAGDYGNDTVFIAGGKRTEMSADAVIGIEKAIECVRQFWLSCDRPTCIEWREL